jgi:outer membrane biosynthesis protein TonB
MNATTPALRIALIHAGRIIEDRTLAPGKKATVSVGADAKNTFCVPMGTLPSSTVLFKVTKEHTVLLRGGFEGRAAVSGHEQALSELPAELALPKGAKGRVKLGDVTVLFQMVAPAPKPELPTLPKGARGVTAQLDRAFVVAMALSFAAHLIGAGYVMAQPMPEEPELSLAELQQDRFAAVLMPIPKPERAPEPPKPSAAPAVAEQPKKPTPTQVAEAPKAAAKPRGDVLRQRVSSMGMLAIIGSVGGEGGLAGDLLKTSSGVGNVADAMQGAGVKVASVDDALKAGVKGEQSGQTVTVGALGTNGARQVELQEHVTATVVGRVREEPISVDTPDISPEALSAWMKQRRGSIQSCYERELKRNHGLAGRLVLKFVITPRGRVAALDLSEGTLQDPAMSDCIRTMMRNWVMPFTPEDEVPVAFPFVFSPEIGRAHV